MDLLERLERKEQGKSGIAAYLDYMGEKKLGALAVMAASLILIAAVLIYVAASRQIYFWGNATYWEMSCSLLNSSQDAELWDKIWNSIGTADYNYIPALPSALWMRIFGQSRISYVMGIAIMYVIPINALTYSLAKKLTERPLFAFFAAVFSMPFLLYMTVCGYADLGGTLMITAVFSLYYTKDGISDRWYRYLLIGLLLTAMMIFRHYFAFFTVSFLTVMIMDCILFRRKRINAITVLVIIAALMATVFLPFLKGVLARNYGNIYSGYVFAFAADMKLITRYFGLIFIVIAALAPIIAGIAAREFRPAMLGLQMVVCTAMLMSTQTHDRQHLLIYAPLLMLFVLFAVRCLKNRASLAVIAAVMVLNMGSVWIRRGQQEYTSEVGPISMLPSFSMHPVKQPYTQELLAIRQSLDGLIPEGAACGIMAASTTLNGSILKNAAKSLGAKAERDGSYIVPLAGIDTSDAEGLETLYNTEYILVGIPAQTYPAAGGQRIVEAAADSFANGTDIAELYHEITEFSFRIDTIDVKLFQRYQDIDAIRKHEFEAKFY